MLWVHFVLTLISAQTAAPDRRAGAPLTLHRAIRRAATSDIQRSPRHVPPLGPGTLTHNTVLCTHHI